MLEALRFCILRAILRKGRRLFRGLSRGSSWHLTLTSEILLDRRFVQRFVRQLLRQLLRQFVRSAFERSDVPGEWCTKETKVTVVITGFLRFSSFVPGPRRCTLCPQQTFQFGHPVFADYVIPVPPFDHLGSAARRFLPGFTAMFENLAHQLAEMLDAWLGPSLPRA
jgi:hypothetical protein